MVTIKDIAREAGVSIATVSYVLNDSSKVGDKTRKKVLKIARDMGYKTNTVARSLRTNESKIAGVVVEELSDFSPAIIKGIIKYAEEKDYHIILDVLKLKKGIDQSSTNLDAYKDKINEHIDILLGRQIEGLIYVGSHVRDVTGIIDDIAKPIVYAYSFTREPGSYSVNYNDKLAAYEATEYLIKSGHRKIGLICGVMNSLASHDRLVGYQEALVNNNLSFNPDYVKVGDWSYETGYEKSRELLELPDRPTAIFCMSDRIGIGAEDSALEMGLNLPGDLSIIGFDNQEFGYFHKPGLTTMDVPLYEIGTESMRLLTGLIQGEEIKEKDIKLECQLLERESVARINHGG